MNIQFDPIVADALEQIAPQVEADPDEILRGARARAAAGRPAGHRATRTAILVFATAAILAGAALAARQLDLLPWLKTNNPSSALYSVDPHHRFRGPVPSYVRCPAAGRSATFACTATAGSNPTLGSLPPRVYGLSQRIAAEPTLTRAFILAAVKRAEAKGWVSRTRAERIRKDALGVGDRFYAFLNLLVTIQGTASSPGIEQDLGHGPVYLVPPAGVPQWIVCAQRLNAALGCRNLAESVNVPVGAAVYDLAPGTDWRRVARLPRDRGLRSALTRSLIRHLLGRDLMPVELRLLIDLGTANARASGHVTRSRKVVAGRQAPKRAAATRP
jgi:hypothetical protein